MSEETNKEVKPGYKSTEFWLTLVATIIGAVLASGITGDNQWVQMVGAIASVLAPAAYARGRSLVKAKDAEKK